MDDLEAEHLARLKRLGHTYTLNLIMELKQKVEQLEADVEDWQDKWHECVCGDLEVALGKIEQLEDVIKALRKGPRQIDLSSCEARVKELDGKIEQLQARNKELEGKLTATEKGVKILADSLLLADKTIEQLEATIKEWESGALVRGWREIRADAQPPEDET